MDLEHEETKEPETTALPDRPEHRRAFRMGYLAALATLVVVIVIAGAGFAFGHYVFTPPAPGSPFARTNFPSFNFGNSPNLPTVPGYTSPPTSPRSSATDAAAAKIAKSVAPGLVDINSGVSYQGASGAGTGIVISANGLVLTNNHVIEGATTITARDVANNKTYQVKVLGYDVTKDVALLKLEGASGLTTVSIGKSSSVKVNEQIVGVGNAGGVGGAPSYAAGTIVATDQSLTASSEVNPSGSEQLSGMIETNAPIQAGDSGGPLVTTSGKVIGIDTAAGAGAGGFYFSPYGTSPTQAYAVPITTALDIAKSIETGISTASIHVGPTAILGIEAVPTNAISSGFNATPSTTNGVAVQGFVPNSPVSKSALAVGDIITAFDGQDVSSVSELSALELSLKPGDSATIEYRTQSGVQQSLTLNLIAGPPQ